MDSPPRSQSEDCDSRQSTAEEDDFDCYKPTEDKKEVVCHSIFFEDEKDPDLVLDAKTVKAMNKKAEDLRDEVKIKEEFDIEGFNASRLHAADLLCDPAAQKETFDYHNFPGEKRTPFVEDSLFEDVKARTDADSDDDEFWRDALLRAAAMMDDEDMEEEEEESMEVSSVDDDEDVSSDDEEALKESAHRQEKSHEQFEQEKNALDPAEMTEEVDSDGMEGVVELTAEHRLLENVAVIIQPPINDSPVIQTLSAAVQSKNSEEVSKLLSSQPSPVMDAIYDEPVDDILESVDADDFTISSHPLQNDDPLDFDASLEEDLLEQKAMDYDRIDNENEEHRESADVDEEGENSDGEGEQDDDGINSSDEEATGTKDTQKRNRRLSNPVGRLLFTCLLKKCPSNFKKFKELEEHVKTHPGRKDFFCDVCKTKFSSKKAAMTHVQEREKKKCCGCGKTFSCASKLIQHLRCHTGERPFLCQTCGQQFAQRNYLNVHMLTHTGEKPFSCGFCKKTLSTKNRLKEHELTHTREKAYKCKHCDYSCNTSGSLSGHTQRHTGAFACGLCDRRFSKKFDLKRHEVVHTGEELFQCDQCGRKFNVKSNLRKHVRIHTGQKPYSCKKCDKEYAQSGSLKVHMKQKHQTQKNLPLIR